jgi:hypothetical protein
VCFEQNVKTKDGLYWFENHRAFIQKQIFLGFIYFILFYCHHVICLKGSDQSYTSYTRGNKLTTFGRAYVPPLHDVQQESDTPFKFDNFLHGLVHLYATKIYEDITLKFINQNSTPCLVLTEEDNFNLSTTLNLKQSMNVRPEHTIKPKHMNVNEGSTIKLFAKGRKHGHVMVNIG